jgi:predicted nuclease of restriction endonuclease-like (RecB) superfamily
MSKKNLNKKQQTRPANLEKGQTLSAQFDTEVYEAIRGTLAEARNRVATAVNTAMVMAYWEVGRQISEAIGERAEYGRGLIKYISEHLSAEFGKGFDESSLRKMRKFYMMFPIRDSLSPELTWTHYRLLIRIEDPVRRDFYIKECVEADWTVRQLDRQINSFYYERQLATQKKYHAEIASEVLKLEPKTDADYILKDPYILEFLDLKGNTKYTESELEQGLIDKLQEFLLELGKGFSFVSRQKRITTEQGEHYYIDLVFYNYILKCFVVIDLKAGKLIYQDIEQIDFYVRLFDEKIKGDDDNPTIGIVLVSSKDESIVKYSVLADKENLFASNYRLYLPSEEELKAELQRERELIDRQIEEADRGDNE